jgi:excisionase family DNA binding protein
METLDRLLTTQQLADYLGVPVATLYAWRYTGDGPPGFRVGKHLRYRIADVEEWIHSQLNAVHGPGR